MVRRKNRQSIRRGKRVTQEIIIDEASTSPVMELHNEQSMTPEAVLGGEPLVSPEIETCNEPSTSGANNSCTEQASTSVAIVVEGELSRQEEASTSVSKVHTTQPSISACEKALSIDRVSFYLYALYIALITLYKLIQQLGNISIIILLLLFSFLKVMKRMMAYLPDRSLFNCRLVSKQLNQHASVELRKRVFVFFDGEDCDDTIVGMRPFMAQMAMTLTPYITRVYLLDIDLASILTMQFFYTYGSSIRDLRIEYSNKSRGRAVNRDQSALQMNVSQWNVRDLRMILLGCVPNLESLELIGLPWVGRTETIFDEWFRQGSTITERIPRSKLPSSRMQENDFIHRMNPRVRGNCCNLRSLRVESPGRKSRRWSFIDDLIWMSDRLEKISLGFGVSSGSIITALQNYGRLVNLKTLIFDELLYPDLAALTLASEQYNLGLQRLEIQMSLATVAKKASGVITAMESTGNPHYLKCLESFISSQSKTLKVLKVTPDPEYDPQPRLTEMEHVVELKMNPDECRIEYFLSPFRNLRKLSLINLRCKDNSEWNMYFPLVPCANYRPRVEDLELPYGFQNHLMLKRIKQYFPELNSLTVKGIDDKKFLLELWTCWRKLQELHLELKADFKEDTDRLFTGYNEKLMKESFHGGTNHFTPSSSITSLTSKSSWAFSI